MQSLDTIPTALGNGRNLGSITGGIKEVVKPQHKEFRRPLLSILEDLKKPVNRRFIKTKSLKGNKIDYIPWTALTRLMDYYAPGWDWKITTSFDGQRVCVMGELTIKAAEGDFTRSATGNEFSEVEHFGDPYSNAEAMAFRRTRVLREPQDRELSVRCCGRWGLGLHLWAPRRSRKRIFLKRAAGAGV